jgi:hypothetical protein
MSSPQTRCVASCGRCLPRSNQIVWLLSRISDPLSHALIAVLMVANSPSAHAPVRRASRTLATMEVNAVHRTDAAVLPNRDSPATPRTITSAVRRYLGSFANGLLVIEAFASLIVFDALSLSGYKRVHGFTRSRPIARRRTTPGTANRVCRAVDDACVWYYTRVYCLQRSTVTTWMLRRRGVCADLVIGFIPVPLRSHAWVEVDGAIVNDRPEYQTVYRQLDRL